MEVLIPYATQVSSGSFVTPDEVENGENCGCICSACDAPMVAKQGGVNVWHFAHKQKYVVCFPVGQEPDHFATPKSATISL